LVGSVYANPTKHADRCYQGERRRPTRRSAPESTPDPARTDSSDQSHTEGRFRPQNAVRFPVPLPIHLNPRRTHKVDPSVNSSQEGYWVYRAFVPDKRSPDHTQPARLEADRWSETA